MFSPHFLCELKEDKALALMRNTNFMGSSVVFQITLKQQTIGGKCCKVATVNRRFCGQTREPICMLQLQRTMEPASIRGFGQGASISVAFEYCSRRLSVV
jgi:hypothetical protein